MIVKDILEPAVKGIKSRLKKRKKLKEGGKDIPDQRSRITVVQSCFVTLTKKKMNKNRGG